MSAMRPISEFSTGMITRSVSPLFAASMASSNVGLGIAACGLFGGSVSGASMNPARSIVPLVLSGQAGLAWIYAAGPFGGAVIATAIAYALCGSPSAPEAQAARGK